MAPPSRSPALDSNQESKPSNQERPPPRSTPRLKKNGRTQCYYESLGVERNVGEDELKQAYRKLAMQWHPDKNADNVEEATEMFKVIQNAYSVLSDPNERSWYDRHREQILRGAGPSDDCSDDEDIDLFPYFSASAFKGFGDDEGGFYATYADVFAEIDNLEREQGEDDEDTPTRARGRGREVAPGFGTSTSEWPEVRDFYNHWLGFSTRRPMYSHDKWDLREAPNRFMRRAMEKENKKERQGARREYSAQVRQLVEFVRKRDRRVQAHNERVDTETREREAAMRAKRAEEQRAYDAERSRVAAELAAEDDEEMVQLLEAAAANLGLGPRGKRGKKGGNGGGSGSGQGGGAPSSAAADAAGADGGVAGGEEADPAMLYCPACNKDFRSIAQLQNHERSKKHLEKAAELRAYLETLGEGEEEEGGRESDQEEEEDGYQEDVEDKADDDDDDEDEEGEKKTEQQQQQEDAAKPSGASRAGGDAAADVSATSAAGRAPAEQRSSDESAAASDSDDASALQARAARRLARKQHVAFAEEDGDEGAELFSHLTLGGSRRGRAHAGGGGVQVARAPRAPSADGGTDGEPAAAPTNGRAKARRRAKRADVRSGDEPPAPAPAPASSGEDGMVGGGKAARKQKKGKAAAAGEDEQDFECKSCGQQFSTRNKLFQHIKTDCHPAQLAALRKQK